MNQLIIIMPSDMKNESDVRRAVASIDVSKNVILFFINQSSSRKLEDIIQVEKCTVKELSTGHVIPLSAARNLALDIIYKNMDEYSFHTVVMFVDDDAWFPEDTIDYLLNFEAANISLMTIDPAARKSFKKVKPHHAREIKGYHLISDIVSICLVVILNDLYKCKIYFNEKIGLGNDISQGEESYFIYQLHAEGVSIYYDSHYIYHPYKKTFNTKNFYSLSYFLAYCSFHKSSIFVVPFLKNLIKYTVMFVMTVKDKRYSYLFINVWKGVIDGIIDSKKVFR